MLPDFKQNLYGALRQRHLHVITVKATFATAGSTITLDTAGSSPNVSIQRDGTGQFTIKMPTCLFLHPIGSPVRVLAEAGAGQFADWESFSLSTGGFSTATFETSSTKGTAADPADGEVIYATLLLGKI